MFWKFVESCARGHLPIAECAPVLQFGAILILLLSAMALLGVVVFQRLASEAENPIQHRATPTPGSRLGSAVAQRHSGFA